jgi:hypothetical protein
MKPLYGDQSLANAKGAEKTYMRLANAISTSRAFPSRKALQEEVNLQWKKVKSNRVLLAAKMAELHALGPKKRKRQTSLTFSPLPKRPKPNKTVPGPVNQNETVTDPDEKLDSPPLSDFPAQSEASSSSDLIRLKIFLLWVNLYLLTPGIEPGIAKTMHRYILKNSDSKNFSSIKKSYGTSRIAISGGGRVRKAQD